MSEGDPHRKSLVKNGGRRHWQWSRDQARMRIARSSGARRPVDLIRWMIAAARGSWGLEIASWL
jgi:hypothetical protein